MQVVWWACGEYVYWDWDELSVFMTYYMYSNNYSSILEFSILL